MSHLSKQIIKMETRAIITELATIERRDVGFSSLS